MNLRRLLIPSAISVALIFSTLSLAKPFSQADDQSGTRAIRTKSTARVGATRAEVSNGAGPQINLWAVLIGVSQFQYGNQDLDGNEIPNLRYADADAQAMYDFLRSPEGGGFRDESEGGHLVLLKDEEATKANVEKALAKLKQAGPNDFFMIFIAAHGVLVPETDPVTKTGYERPYFALHDTDPRNFRSTGLPMQAFRDLVGQIPARKGIVLSDTCNSAGVQLSGRSGTGSPRVNARYIEEMKSVERGIGFIWSAGQFETAKEPLYLGHGAFTYCLLDGLRGEADRNSDTKVTFNEIAEYVREEVPKITEDTQHPYYTTDVVEANYLALSAVDYADLNPETGATQYGTLVLRTPDLDGVEVAIDGQPYEKLSSRFQRTVRLRAGTRNLSFTKGAIRKEVQAQVAPRKSKLVEVNLSFSQGDEDSLVEANTKQLNVFLTEDKEPSKEAKDLFHRGVDSFHRQKFEEAVDLLTRAVQANGGAYADALVFLGRAQQSLGRHEAAVVSYKAALALRPSDYETQTLLAGARLDTGDNVEDIIKQLDGITYRHPNYEFARVVYADALLTRRDYAGAERQLRRAIDAVPLYPPAHMIMAEALSFQKTLAKQKLAIKEADTAIQQFAKVSQKQVSLSKGLKRLSMSHVIFGGGKYVNHAAMAEAKSILAYALVNYVELDAGLTDRDVYLSRARANIDEVLQLLDKRPDKGRKEPDADADKKSDKDSDKERKSSGKRAKKDRTARPSGLNEERLARALDLSAQIYQLQGNTAMAIKEGERALALTANPDMQSEIHYTLHSAYTSEQRYDKAVEHLEKYLALAGSFLTPKERIGVEENLELARRKRDAIKQKK